MEFINKKKGENAIFKLRREENFAYPVRIIVLENMWQMNVQEIEFSNILNTKERVFHFRGSLVQQQSFKHFTAAPNNDRASNKPSWES